MEIMSVADGAVFAPSASVRNTHKKRKFYYKYTDFRKADIKALILYFKQFANLNAP